MSNDLSKFIPKPAPSGRILTGLAARRAQVALDSNEPLEIPIEQLEHRIGLVFDDSYSMSDEQIADAHVGCEEFLRSCEKDKTAVAVYPMNSKKLLLCRNLPAVALMIKQIKASGATPLIEIASEMLRENKLTRAIIFSDGSPDNRAGYEKLLGFGIPIDTVYFSSNHPNLIAAEFMQKLAQDTGGIYLHFERGKSNFRTAFKYLSPGLRYMLADSSFKEKIQGR